eukprot:GHVU01140108.1.p1 GENE.GHVU01140108.1~~GHVU01140108.1.p1  ORF type:complete len:153 (-),score=6.05 GHVU01140108.1:305-763(-)
MSGCCLLHLGRVCGWMQTATAAAAHVYLCVCIEPVCVGVCVCVCGCVCGCVGLPVSGGALQHGVVWLAMEYVAGGDMYSVREVSRHTHESVTRRIRTYTCTHTHTHMHTQTYTHAHTDIHTHIRIYIHTYIHTAGRSDPLRTAAAVRVAAPR